MRKLLTFVYVKTSVDKEHRFRKMKSMQYVMVTSNGKIICYSILIFAISLFGCPPCFGCRGRRLVSPPPLHATGYSGLENGTGR